MSQWPGKRTSQEVLLLDPTDRPARATTWERSKNGRVELVVLRGRGVARRHSVARTALARMLMEIALSSVTVYATGASTI